MNTQNNLRETNKRIYEAAKKKVKAHKLSISIIVISLIILVFVMFSCEIYIPYGGHGGRHHGEREHHESQK